MILVQKWLISAFGHREPSTDPVGLGLEVSHSAQYFGAKCAIL